MLLRSIRRMCDPLLERKWRWRLYFLQVIWLFLAAETSPTVSGYFLGDIKAVLNGCEDHWTLQGRTSIPQLSQMTVCVNIQVVVPGHWVAFSYSSVRTPNPNLGLEGDDNALYVWLLQVRHQFPFKISPMQWQRVCLRRDVQRNTFSVEVDYKIVAERTVIAQAIPPSGSLWLGCHQRRRTPEVAMGKVELYLFRMWADLGEHRSCEDGTVIGWNANHWEVTSPKAKETDPSLSCEHKRLRRGANSADSALKGGLGNVTGSSPGTPKVICDISQLCSNNSAYYWMSISVENETAFALNLVSKVFSCNRAGGETSTSNSYCINLFNDFPELESLQVEEVSCRENTTSNKRQTICSVVLFLKHAISACDLQQYGEKALKSESVQAHITGNLERVGRNLCKDGLPPSDGFVKCLSNSSLNEICQSEERTKVKCSVLQTNSVPSPQETTNSCNRSMPRYCDCSASCDTTSQLYAIKIKITNSTVTMDHLKHLLKSYASTWHSEERDSNDYSDIFKKHKRTHLECHGVKNERLYSCMVILEMSQPVNYCSLRKLWQLIVKEKKFITSDGSPSRMMVCGGDPDLSNLTVVALNLTWSEVDLNSSHFCRPDPIRLECKANETLAVLLADSCPEEPETLSTFQPTTPNAILTGISTLNHTSQNTERKQTTSSTPSDKLTIYNFTTASNTLTLKTATVNFTGKTVSTTESVSTSTDTDFIESSFKPSNNMTTETIAILSSSNKTENTNTIPSENLTVFYNATNNGTTLYNDTTPSKKETGMSPTTTPTNNNNSSNTKTTVYTATTPNNDETLVSPTTTTINNNQTTVYNAITPNNNETLVSPATTRVNNKGNQTPMYNVATTNNNETLVSATTTMVKNSNNQTAVYNVETPNNNLTLVSPTTITINNNNNQTTLNNATTPNNKETLVSPTTITINNNNQTTVYNAISPRNNETMVTTPSNNTTIYNATTTRNNYTTLHIGSDPSIDHKTSYDLTTPSNSNITVHNATTQSYKETALTDTTIPSKQNTTVYNAKTGSNNHSTVYNAKSLTEHYTPVYNATTAKNNYTTGNNATTPQNNLTLVYNATTLTENLILYNKTTNNFTTVYNTKTTNNYRTTNSALLNEKHTNEYNLTTVSSNYTTLNNSTTSIKKNYTTFTATAPSNNYTTVYNTTAITEKHIHNYNTTASSNNYTSVYNATSSNTKHTAVQNTTTPSNSYTTEQNVTAKNNYTTVYHATISSINMTTVHKPTMTSIPFTTNQNITYITSNFTNKYNATLFTTTSNTASPSKSSTTNMVGVQNTATLNYSSTLHPAINSSIIYTSVTRLPRNATTAFNISIAPVDPQQITTTLNINTTVVAALTEVGRTTKLNSTTESWTSLADNSTKPTQHSMLNQTGNQTTVTVTQMTTVHKNDSNLGVGFSTIQATKPLSSNLTTDTVSLFTATTENTTLTTHDPTKKRPVSSATKTTTLPSNKATMSTVTSTGNTLMTTMKTSTSTENKEEKANELLDQTEDVSKLNSSLVSNLVGNLEKLLESPSISQSVGKKVIDIISNLMNCDPEILSGSTNRLVQLVDNLGLKLEVMGVSGMLSSTSLVLAIKTVDGTNFPETSVEIFNTDNVQLRSISRSRVKRSASALGSVNLPSSLTAGLLPEEKLQASRVQFTFYKNNFFFQDSSLDNQTVVSAVLGSSVANLSISNLKENITFTIRHMSLSLNDITSCVFWNFTKNNKAGGWDDYGCSVANTTAEHTTCSCNHLTSFAILLDMSRQGITDPLQAKILSFITYIGCGISSVFLAVTLITYLLFEKLLRDIPAKILVQLCFSLLLLNLVFMLDGWLANYNIVNLCISTAFFLHYFLLSSFTWAGLEALHMYLSIVRVFTPYLSRYMLKFSLMGWGFPLIVVVIIIAVDKNNYGLVPYGKYEDGTTDGFCWLRNDIAFYVGVVAYFLLIFVLCLVVFIVVMVQLYRIKKQNPQNQSPNRSAMTDMRSIIGLVLLLGLSWGFALFAWGDAKLPFIYLFTIFNSLLGLFVFIFHCAVKENVRRMWRMYLCCGNLRLANNIEWSRTATHNNKQLSAATGTTSAQQLSNRSSSFASNLTNSSGSVFVDSDISDHSNSDVVLNEIQRRSVSPIDEP